MCAQSSSLEIPLDDEINFETPDDLHQLKVMWIFGIDENVPPKCVTNGNIIYAASNIVVLYNYIENKSYFFHHKNKIINVDCDSKGRWIVTAASGKNNVVNIWETETLIPLRTILNPHGSYCLEKATMSSDTQYLLTYANEKYPKISIWKCKCDDTAPNATVCVDLKNYAVIDIIFNPNNSKEFCLATEGSIYIGHWDEKISNEIILKKTSSIMRKYKDYGNFNCLSYITKNDQVYVCTDQGFVAVYGFLEVKIRYQKEHKDFIKLVKIDKHCIQTMTQSEEYVITANIKGMINIYNCELKILLVYNNSHVGIVNHLSFIPRDVKKDFQSGCESEDTSVRLYDPISNLLTYCNTDGIALLDVVRGKYCNIINTKQDQITAIATHPELPYICFGDKRGKIRLINYDTHSPIADVSSLSTANTGQNSEEGQEITCLKYSPSGTFLACSVQCSGLWFLDLSLLTPIIKKPLKDTKFIINLIEFSQNSSNVVICFKYKILDCETGKILATYLSPRYLSAVNRMKIITQKDTESNKPYLLFATNEHIGLQILPLDGNPFNYIAQLAHPKQINNCILSADCKKVFTSGVDDSTITEWQVDLSMVQKRSAEGGKGITPYLSLIKGGESGRFYKKMKTLFYYAQILCQGSYTPHIRDINDRMNVSKLPDIMRTIGYFPTEYQIENIMREVNYQTFNNTINNFISFDDFVKLYINHRPAFGEKYLEIRDAFILFSECQLYGPYLVNKDTFLAALKKFGDCFSDDDIHYIFKILTQVTTQNIFHDSVLKESDDFLPEVISMNHFFKDLLGLTLRERRITDDKILFNA